MFACFLKESLTFHRPVSKWGERNAARHGGTWERALSGAARGFIWSIDCHGNSECDLEASLAPGQVERFGKKAEPPPGSEQGRKAAALAQPPGGRRGAPVSYCAKAHSEVPPSSDEREGQCHCSRWPGSRSMLGTYRKLFFRGEVPPSVSFTPV